MVNTEKLTEELIRSVIFHEDDVEEVLEAIEEGTIEYIRHDLYVTLSKLSESL